MANLKGIKVAISFMIVIGLFLVTPTVISASPLVNAGQTVAVDSLVSKGISSYRISVKNTDIKSHKYSLSYGTLPSKFKAEFLLEGKVTKQIEVKAKDTVVVLLQVDVPMNVKAGTEIIKVNVKRDDGQNDMLPLSVTINNDYSLVITNQVKGLNVINGKSTSLDIEVKNTGSKILNNVSLKLELPYKWIDQSGNPVKLQLRPGESGLFKVQILIPTSENAGNKSIKLYSFSDSIKSPQTEIIITVQNNPNYFYFIVGFIIIAGIGTLLYFRKNGRR